MHSRPAWQQVGESGLFSPPHGWNCPAQPSSGDDGGGGGAFAAHKEHFIISCSVGGRGALRRARARFFFRAGWDGPDVVASLQFTSTPSLAAACHGMPGQRWRATSRAAQQMTLKVQAEGPEGRASRAVEGSNAIREGGDGWHWQCHWQACTCAGRYGQHLTEKQNQKSWCHWAPATHPSL